MRESLMVRMVLSEVVLPDAIPQSLISVFTQSNAISPDERPVKRRKVARNGPYSLAQERGLSAAGVPIGYIPLARLLLHIKFAASTVNNENSSRFSTSGDPLPVLVQVKSTGPRSRSATSLPEEASSDDKTWKLELSTTDAERRPVLVSGFDDTGPIDLLEQLRLASQLISADRYVKRPPTACYQGAVYPTSDSQSFRLEVAVLWKDSLEIPDIPRLEGSVLEVFSRYVLQEDHHLHEKRLGSTQRWTPREFYESVHVPQNTESASADIKLPDLVCELFPFQRRAVRWLLWREGMELQGTGQLTPIERRSHVDTPASFRKVQDADGNICYFSHLFMTITTNISDWSDAPDHLHGGILAEEMGLGKTVEMIALISLNRRLAMPNFDPDGLRVSGATLIITPPAILDQWKQELEQHAPKLRVHHYTGVKRGQEQSDHLVIEEIADCDVVLTTYHVIAREIHYAGATPERSLRHEKRFEPRKTPLVRISWWRVCLDEAQMIESGVSNAAKVARLIPRQNAWAVTGTPLRKNIDDLFGLLLFLQYHPFSDSNPLWNRLFSRFGPVLKSIINSITLRHSKDHVRNELRLPPQKRIVITTPFTAVEEQHYGQLFEEMCEQCGLDAAGAPLRGDWDPEDPMVMDRMRTWLTRLRQTCLHPEVSGSNRRALGSSNGPLRTVDEVLEVMIENNDTAIRTEERALLLSQLRRGQLLENAKRRKESLALWQSALDHSTKLVEDSREQLRLQRLKAKDLPHDGKNSAEVADLSDEDSEEMDKNSRIGQCRLKLRAALEIQHIAVFFTANAYYQIKSDPELTQPDSEDFKALQKTEEGRYEAAKQIRQEMLTDISRKVERYMKIIKDKAQQKQFVQIPKMKPYLYNRGLESYRLLNKFEGLCAALNQHAEKYNEWRDVMIKLVSQSLIDQEDDAELEGNEYERSTKHQDEMYVYMEALRSMYADRHDALTGQKNVLISHEVKAGIIQAKAGEGPSPQLFLSIMNTRSELMPNPELGSLRGIVSELRSLVTSLEWQASGGSSRAHAELDLVGQVLRNAGQMIAEQLKVSSALEREVEMFRDTMNNRLEYYRHLQQISDTVAPYDEENAGKPMDEELYRSKVKQEEVIEGKISSLQSKRRYLFHIRDESELEDNSRICVICQSSFEVGVLTVCGHKYCTDCLRYWWRAHRTCPICKRPLKLRDFHQITYNPQQLVAQEEDNIVKFDHERLSKNAIYSDISSGLLNQIKTIDLDDSFGTKIDTLARHIIWLREHDPGAKSIVFSQYKNFLTILQRAFQRLKIVSTRVDVPGGIEKFKKDPAVECFLLHGKAQSSGLTLINATHVFLCEPLINTAIELQAIARVHRIGQHRPTTVWMYLVSGTVEESIYELSVTRRLAHILEKEKHEIAAQSELGEVGAAIDDLTETAIDSANSLEMQEATLTSLMTSGASGGEIVRNDDLWRSLFGSSTQKESNNHFNAAEREVGRFLRGEAAEQRRDGSTDCNMEPEPSLN